MQEWQSMAEARQARIEQLEQNLADHKKTAAAEVEEMRLSIDTLRGEVAQLQRNEMGAKERELNLRRLLDESEARCKELERRLKRKVKEDEQPH